MRLLVTLSGSLFSAGLLGYAFGSTPAGPQDLPSSPGTESADSAAQPASATPLFPDSRSADVIPQSSTKPQSAPVTAAEAGAGNNAEDSDPFGPEKPPAATARPEPLTPSAVTGPAVSPDSLPAAQRKPGPLTDVLPPPTADNAVLTSPVSDTVQAVADTPALHVLRLQSTAASAVADVVLQMFNDRKLIVAADDRSNSLIVRCTPADLQEITALVQRLDTESRDDGVPHGRPVRLSDAEQRFERQIAELQGQLRAATAGSSRNPSESGSRNQQVELLTRQLHDVLSDVFDERQRRQLAEIEELTVRLQTLARQVRDREERKAEIVRNRLSQLLDDEQHDADVPDTRSNESATSFERTGAAASSLPALQSQSVQSSAPGQPAASAAASTDDAGMAVAVQLGHRVQDHLSAIHQTQQRLGSSNSELEIRQFRRAMDELYQMLQQDAKDAALQRKLAEIELTAAQQELQIEQQSIENLTVMKDRGVVSSTELNEARRTLIQLQAKHDRRKTLVEFLQKLEKDLRTISTPDAPAPQPDSNPARY